MFVGLLSLFFMLQVNLFITSNKMYGILHINLQTSKTFPSPFFREQPINQSLIDLV